MTMSAADGAGPHRGHAHHGCFLVVASPEFQHAGLAKSLKIRPGSEDEMTEGTELQTAVSDSEAEALLAAFAGEEEGHGDAEQAATVINPTRYVTCRTWVQPQNNGLKVYQG